MSTTIYLDVDGVLNAVTHKSPSLTKLGWGRWDSWQTAPVNGWPILWAPDLIAALNELADREDVTIKWLTTWTDDAAKVLSPAIGINGQDWPVLHGDLHGWRGRTWWKLEAIRADVEATSPDKFIWIDDDLSMEREAIEWLDGQAAGLGISPFMSEGLTADNLTQITNYINQAVEAAA